NTELSLIAFIGIILLIGIVKKNGIMMVDFALEGERKRGLAPERAIYEACLERFRPIMMTTMAALLGAVPLVLATGPGSELRRRRQVGEFLRISLIHARGETVLGKLLGEDFAHHRDLVGVVDLVAAETPADPGLGHALCVADGDALVLEGEVPRRGGAGVEVLVEPHVRRHDQRADLPIVLLRR